MESIEFQLNFTVSSFNLFTLSHPIANGGTNEIFKVVIVVWMEELYLFYGVFMECNKAQSKSLDLSVMGRL